MFKIKVCICNGCHNVSAWSFSRSFFFFFLNITVNLPETPRKRVEVPRICLEQAPVVFVYSTWCVKLSGLCRCAWDLVENLQLCLRLPLPSNEPSMHTLNHTPVGTHWKGLFSSPARHEVETLLVLMDQWPACSPDVEVVTKTEQLSLFNLSLSASRFASFLLCSKWGDELRTGDDLILTMSQGYILQ